jgi:tRNA-dihydrouridine synthase B
LKIGNIILPEKPVFLAPMEDITDPSFRTLCKEFGVDFMYTEFISSEGLIRDGRKSVLKLNLYDEERPIGIQLYGNIVESMVEAAIIAEAAKPDLIDLNFGCPVKKIAGRGAGSGMMKNVPLMVDITRSVVDAVKVPVTAKTRLGWDNESKNIADVAERLQDTGIDALTIHGRTRAQMYKGEADWTLIGEVKNNPRMTIPIIGNGDIDGAEKAALMFNRYGVDGIMVGRASVGRPWIFREIKHFLEKGELLAPPTLDDKVNIALKHLNLSLSHKEGARGIYELRRHLSNYFKGLPDFKDTRLQLLTSTDTDEIRSLLEYIRKKWKDFNPGENNKGVYGL